VPRRRQDECARLKSLPEYEHLKPVFDAIDGEEGMPSEEGASTDETEAAHQQDAAHALLSMRKKMMRKHIVGPLRNEPEQTQQVALAVESLLANEKVFVCDLDRPLAVRRLLNQLTNADRVPDRSSYGALLLLRDAYDRIDVFNTVAQRNKLRSKITYTTLLVLNLLVVVWNTISPDLDLPDRRLEAGSDELGVRRLQAASSNGSGNVLSTSGSSGSGLSDLSTSALVILGLSVANTLAAGVITLLNPIVKWKALRAAAMALDSEVFAYRTRTGLYAPPTGMLSEQADRNAERLLAERIRASSDHVFDRAAVADTAFFGKHVLRGGGTRKQHDPSADAEQATVLVQPSVFSRLRRCGRRWCGRSHKVADEGPSTAFGATAAAADPALDRLEPADPNYESELLWPAGDDFHTPLPSSAYVRFRLRPAIDFCQRRLPVRHCYHVLAQLALLVTSATSVVLATVGYASYVSIAAGLAYYVTAYVEFSEWARKVRRYSGVVKRLSNLLVWWNELSDTEKALVANVDRLVGETESTLMFAMDAWADTSAQTNAVGTATGSKEAAAKEKDLEADKGKEGPARGALPEAGGS